MSKELIAALAKLAGLQGDALASCVNDDGSVNTEEVAKALPKIEEAHTSRLRKIREEAAEDARKEASKKGSFDDGFKKGQATGHERSEERVVKMLGKEAEGKSGDELFDLLAEALKGEKRKELTADDVERSPFHLQSITKLKDLHKQELEKVKNELGEKEKTWQRKETISELRKRVMPMIKELNLNISDDEAVRERRMEKLFEEIVRDHDFTIEGDNVVISTGGKVKKDEKTLENVALKDHVTGICTFHYDTLASQPKSSPGVDNKGASKPAGKWNKPLPKNEAEYQKAIVDDSIPSEERASLIATWKEQRAAA